MSENPDPQTSSNAHPQLINLPIETLNVIFEFVALSQPCTPRAVLLPLLTVSKLFYNIAITLLYRTVSLVLHKKRQYCHGCKTDHRSPTLRRLESLFKRNSKSCHTRNLEIDIDIKTEPAWKRVLSLVKLVPKIVSIKIRIDGVVKWNASRQGPEPIVYDDLRTFYRSFQLFNNIELFESLECYISEVFWTEYFTSVSRHEMSKQIPERVKELTLNVGLSCYPDGLKSLRLIIPDYSDVPDAVSVFEGRFAETWLPILSLPDLTTLELNPPPWSILGPVHQPIIKTTGLNTLVVNNRPGCNETTRITSLLLRASEKLASFSWLNSPVPGNFKQTNSSNIQSVSFCLPKSLVHLCISGICEEEEDDSKASGRIPVADLLEAVKLLPVLVHLEIDPQRFRLYKSLFQLACVFSQHTNIRTLIIVDYTAPRNQLSDEFGQLSRALSWDERVLHISCDVIRTQLMNGIRLSYLADY